MSKNYAQLKLHSLRLEKWVMGTQKPVDESLEVKMYNAGWAGGEAKAWRDAIDLIYKNSNGISCGYVTAVDLLEDEAKRRAIKL